MLNFETAVVRLSRDQGEGPVADEWLEEVAVQAVGVVVHDFPDAPGRTFKITLRSLVEYPVLLDRVIATFAGEMQTVLEHGWQSWSTVRSARPSDIRPERGDAPRWFRGEMLADRDGAGTLVTVDTFCLTDTYVLGALTATTCLLTFAVTETAVEAHYLLDDVILEPGMEFELDTLWYREGPAGPNYSTYAERAGLASNARVDRGAPTGWCSWYHYFTNVTSAHIEANGEIAAAHGLGLVQIDDGWQAEIGDWSSTSPRFGTPIGDLATSIVADGGVAGLWSAPFLAIEGGKLATEHPDWLVLNDQGLPATALFHETWGGKVFALDTTRDDVLAHLVETYRHLSEQGFEYHKVDFLFAAGIPGVRSGNGLFTRAMALQRGLQSIREGIGDDAYLLGCGGPLLSVVGIVDAMRVSEDVAPFYEPKIFFPGFPEGTVATKNAIQQSVLRAPLHRRWFLNDPDCLLLRPTDTELSPTERRVLATSILGTGAYLVASDDLSLYGADEWETFNQLMDLQSAADSTLTLANPFALSPRVIGETYTLEINWNLPSAKLVDAKGSTVFE